MTFATRSSSPASLAPTTISPRLEAENSLSQARRGPPFSITAQLPTLRGLWFHGTSALFLPPTTQALKLTNLPLVSQTVPGSSAKRALLFWVACFSPRLRLRVVRSRLVAVHSHRSYFEVVDCFVCMHQLRTLEICAIVLKSEENRRDEYASEPQFEDAQFVEKSTKAIMNTATSNETSTK